MAPTERHRHRESRHKSKRHKKVHFREKKNSNEKVRAEQLKLSPSPVKLSKSGNNDSLILHYLTKLRKLFSTTSSTTIRHHPTAGCREDSASKLRKEHTRCEIPEKKPLQPEHIQPDRYTSSNPPRPRGEESFEENYDDAADFQEKVYNAVTAAIEYGFKNRILEKRGDYFLLKNKRNKLATRQQTPGPGGSTPPHSGNGSPKNVSRYCSKCSCNNCKSVSSYRGNYNRNCSQHRPITAGYIRDHKEKAGLRTTPRRSYDSMMTKGKSRNQCNCPRCQYRNKYH